MKKVITFILTLTLIVGTSVASASAASKPAKVTGVKASAKKMSVTLKWKKAKRAKKYQIWRLKNNKYKKIKTTKSKKVTIKNLKVKTKYKFKIRGLNGKKKGAFSKVVTIRTKAGKYHKTPVNPAKIKAVEGDTYVFNNTEKPLKITITYVSYEGDEILIEGTTPSGGTYQFNQGHNGRDTFVIFEEKDYTKHITFDCKSAVIDGSSTIFNVKDNSTKACWTLDGIEPKIGQKDLTGYSKWCLMDYYSSAQVGRPLEEAYGGRLMDYDAIKNPNEKYTALIKTKLRGTATKGKSKMWTEPHYVRRENSWIRAYYGSKLIYERHLINNRPMPWNE